LAKTDPRSSRTISLRQLSFLFYSACTNSLFHFSHVLYVFDGFYFFKHFYIKSNQIKSNLLAANQSTK